MGDTMIGVIGGSGVYDIDGLDGAEWRSVLLMDPVAVRGGRGGL